MFSALSFTQVLGQPTVQDTTVDIQVLDYTASSTRTDSFLRLLRCVAWMHTAERPSNPNLALV